jgi:hypothetical protein
MAQFDIVGQTINSSYRTAICNAATEPPLQEYIRTKNIGPSQPWP